MWKVGSVTLLLCWRERWPELYFFCVILVCLLMGSNKYFLQWHWGEGAGCSMGCPYPGWADAWAPHSEWGGSGSEYEFLGWPHTLEWMLVIPAGGQQNCDSHTYSQTPGRNWTNLYSICHMELLKPQGVLVDFFVTTFLPFLVTE